MNFKLFSLLAFVLAIFVFKSASAQVPSIPPMPQMPGGMPGGMPDMPDPSKMAPPGMEEGMQAANTFKDMAMSQVPNGDSMNSK